MATRGLKPGQRQGGRALGSKNKKVTPRDRKLMARAEVLQRELEDHRPPAGTQLSKEILGKFAHNCAAMAMKLMPAFQDSGEPVYRFKGHEKVWLQMMDLTLKYANGAAPYQSPTFRAVIVTPPAVDQKPGDTARVINLKIFENTGTAIALLDEVANSK